MIIIEVAIRGVYSEERERVARAMTHGLIEQASATPWKFVASFSNNVGQDCGGLVYINKGAGKR